MTPHEPDKIAGFRDASGTSPRRLGRLSRNLGWIGIALVAVLLLSLLSSFVFGSRSYRSLALLHSAQAVGAAQTSSVRPWMTIGYVAATYRVPEPALLERLRLPADTDGRTTLRALAQQRGVSPFEFLQTVQVAIAAITASRDMPAPPNVTNGWTWFGDQFLSAILVYGHAALALTLFLGAIGLPVPTGLSTAVAGSLAAQGHLNWAWSIGLAVAASVLGDLVGYGIGRVVDQGLIERRGRWFGYTAANRMRVQALFARWGGVTVLLTRTLVSHLSSVASLLAGLSRFRLTSFLAFAMLGRLIWTAAYFGLGYSVGADFEAASGFLTNLSFLLISIAVFIGVAVVLFSRQAGDAGLPTAAG